MLKKLMSSIVIGSIVLSMAGCTATNESDKQQAQDIINSTKQEQQVQPKEEEVKKEQEQPKQQPKEQSKQQPKQQIKKEQQSKPKESKKKQNDNIDEDTGLAKIKDGTHLQEEADKQDKQNEDDSIWTEDYCPECGKPVDKCICDGDTDDNIDYSNTPIYNDYQEPDEFKEEDEDDYVQIPKDYHIIVDDTKCRDCGELKECCRCEISCDDEK